MTVQFWRIKMRTETTLGLCGTLFDRCHNMVHDLIELPKMAFSGWIKCSCCTTRFDELTRIFLIPGLRNIVGNVVYISEPSFVFTTTQLRIIRTADKLSPCACPVRCGNALDEIDELKDTLTCEKKYDFCTGGTLRLTWSRYSEDDPPFDSIQFSFHNR